MNDTPVGVDYPIQRGNGGYFSRTYTSIEQVKANILNVLSTTRGERPFRPDFGTGLYDLLYEPIEEGLEERVRERVRSTLRRWLPYVTAEQIIVNIGDGTAKIGLQFSTEFTADETENMVIWADLEDE